MRPAEERAYNAVSLSSGDRSSRAQTSAQDYAAIALSTASGRTRERVARVRRAHGAARERSKPTNTEPRLGLEFEHHDRTDLEPAMVNLDRRLPNAAQEVPGISNLML